MHGDTDSTHVADPKVIAAARSLELAARRLVSGAQAGLHSSRRKGSSREFSQYRAYQQGDESRLIDWKVFARSDRYFIRESEVDTRTSVRIIVDATDSMRQCDAARPGLRKFDAARILAAAFAQIAQAQGDPAELVAVTEGGVRRVTSRSGSRPFARIVRALAALEPSGGWPEKGLSGTGALALAPPGADSAAAAGELAVVLTDGHERAGEIRRDLAPLRQRRREILFLHLVTRDEEVFPFEGRTRFEEWETGRSAEVDAASVKPAYLAAHAARNEAWRRAWGDDAFDYARIMIDEPLDRALASFLRRRSGF